MPITRSLKPQALHMELAGRRNTLAVMARAAARRGEHAKAYGYLSERHAYSTALWLYYRGRSASSAAQIETYARDMREANAYAARALAFLNADPQVYVSESGEYRLTADIPTPRPPADLSGLTD